MGIFFKQNTRKQQLDRYEKIVRENKWLLKGEQFQRGDRTFYVIMETGTRLIGYYTIQTHANKQTEIKWLYILPEFQRKGYGEQTLIKIVKTIYKLNNNTAYAFVGADSNAWSMCAKWGYILGVDERLYDPLLTYQTKPMMDDGNYVYVFFQKSWGNTNAIMKEVLRNVLDSSELRK